jgi:hypothetical protein
LKVIAPLAQGGNISKNLHHTNQVPVAATGGNNPTNIQNNLIHSNLVATTKNENPLEEKKGGGDQGENGRIQDQT